MSVVSVDVALKQEPGANLGLVCSCKAFMQPNRKERKGEYESKTCWPHNEDFHFPPCTNLFYFFLLALLNVLRHTMITKTNPRIQVSKGFYFLTIRKIFHFLRSFFSNTI